MAAPLAAKLAITFGTTVATNLLKGLSNRKGGAQKLEAAAAALHEDHRGRFSDGSRSDSQFFRSHCQFIRTSTSSAQPRRQVKSQHLL
jgi:hypothetical protein